MSTQGQHTPGPWWVERRIGDALQVNAKHRGEGSSYCVASINHWEGETDHANARLIAAAPDLLTALRDFEEEISSRFGADKDMSPELAKVVFAARAVIAKADTRS